MSTFSYGGTAYSFPGQSGIFISSTTAVGGSGTQSNPCLLVYRATKRLSFYRDAVAWLPLGRPAPVTEVGSYSYRGMEVQAAYPGTGTDYNGASITRDVVEGRISSIISALQGGAFVDYQDSRGRRLYGTFSSDPVIEDQPVLWTTITFTVVEIAAG